MFTTAQELFATQLREKKLDNTWNFIREVDEFTRLKSNINRYEKLYQIVGTYLIGDPLSRIPQRFLDEELRVSFLHKLGIHAEEAREMDDGERVGTEMAHHFLHDHQVIPLTSRNEFQHTRARSIPIGSGILGQQEGEEAEQRFGMSSRSVDTISDISAAPYLPHYDPSIFQASMNTLPTAIMYEREQQSDTQSEQFSDFQLNRDGSFISRFGSGYLNKTDRSHREDHDDEYEDDNSLDELDEIVSLDSYTLDDRHLRFGPVTVENCPRDMLQPLYEDVFEKLKSLEFDAFLTSNRFLQFLQHNIRIRQNIDELEYFLDSLGAEAKRLTATAKWVEIWDRQEKEIVERIDTSINQITEQDFRRVILLSSQSNETQKSLWKSVLRMRDLSLQAYSSRDNFRIENEHGETLCRSTKGHKIVMTLPYKMDEVVHLWHSRNNILDIDPQIIENHYVGSFEFKDNYSFAVQHQTFKYPWPLYNRDTLTGVSMLYDKQFDRYVVASRSLTEEPKFSVGQSRSSNVRMFVAGGLVFERLQNNHTVCYLSSSSIYAGEIKSLTFVSCFGKQILSFFHFFMETP